MLRVIINKEEQVSIEELARSIRDIPDFPEEGVVFKDITTLIIDPRLFKEAIDRMAEEFFREGDRSGGLR